MELLMNGSLNEHLHEVDNECCERIELLIERMKAGVGITEKLKTVDQMKQAGLMNLEVIKELNNGYWAEYNRL